MAKPEIVIITPTNFPGYNGDTSNFNEIINELSSNNCIISLVCPRHSIARERHDISTLPPATLFRIPFEPPRLYEVKNGIKILHYFKWFFFLISESIVTSKILIHRRIKNVYVRHGVHTLHLPILLRLLGVKVMICDGELISDLLGNGILSKILLCYEKRIINLYSYFKVSSISQARDLEKFGLERRKILFVPISVKLDNIPYFSISEILKHTFGYFGGLEKWQGLEILIHAFQYLLKKIPDAVLYIIGDGTLKDKLSRDVKNAGLSLNIIFVSAIPRDILWRDYFKKF